MSEGRKPEKKGEKTSYSAKKYPTSDWYLKIPNFYIWVEPNDQMVADSRISGSFIFITDKRMITTCLCASLSGVFQTTKKCTIQDIGHTSHTAAPASSAAPSLTKTSSASRAVDSLVLSATVSSSGAVAPTPSLSVVCGKGQVGSQHFQTRGILSP